MTKSDASASETATPGLSDQVDALRGDLAALAEKFSAFAEAESETLARHARAAGRAVNRKAAELGAQTGDMAQAARAQASDLQDALEAYVVENPIRSVVIAAGIGLILGAASRR